MWIWHELIFCTHNHLSADSCRITWCYLLLQRTKYVAFVVDEFQVIFLFQPWWHPCLVASWPLSAFGTVGARCCWRLWSEKSIYPMHFALSVILANVKRFNVIYCNYVHLQALTSSWLTELWSNRTSTTVQRWRRRYASKRSTWQEYWLIRGSCLRHLYHCLHTFLCCNQCIDSIHSINSDMMGSQDTFVVWKHDLLFSNRLKVLKWHQSRQSWPLLWCG